MLELTIKFETEKDKEELATSILAGSRAEGVLDNFNANTVERVGDTLFFTKQELPVEPAIEVEVKEVVKQEEVNVPNIPPPLTPDNLVETTKVEDANTTEGDSKEDTTPKKEVTKNAR